MAQRNHASTGQGGDVNHGLGLEAFGVGQGIAQHQTPFGVGVQNFNGLTTHAGHHIARLDRRTIGHVFGCRYQTHHIEGRFEFTQCFEDA
jgi:hypothetical protein